jgi:predicted permease
VESFLQFFVLVAACGPMIASVRATEVALTQQDAYQDPDRLILLTTGADSSPGSRMLTFGDLRLLSDLTSVLPVVVAFQPGIAVRSLDFDYKASEGTLRLDGAKVSPNFLQVLGSKPLLGRGFTDWTDTAEADEILVSSRFWTKHLSSNKSVLGTGLSIGGRVRTVVGIMPATFKPLGEEADVWIPWRPSPTELGIRSLVCCSVLARIAPNLTMSEANAALAKLPIPNRRIVAVRLNDFVVRDSAQMLRLVETAALILMVLTCATVVYFQIVRSLSRASEFAMMRALGASAAHVFALRMGPSVLMGLTVGIASLGLSYLLLPVLAILLPRIESDRFALTTTAALTSLLCPVLIAVLSAAWLWFVGREPELTTVSRFGRTTNRRIVRFRRVASMVVGGLAACALVASGLVIAELRRTSSTNIGFRARDLTAIELRLWSSAFQKPEARWRFSEEASLNLAMMPGVSKVAVASAVPVVGTGPISVLREGARAEVEVTAVGPGFFDVLGVPLTKGRWFLNGDKLPVAIVSESFARNVLGTSNPLGRSISLPKATEIVGVVPDIVTRVNVRSLPQVYVPFDQSPSSRVWFVLRTSGAIPSEPAIRKAVAAVDFSQPVERIVALDEAIRAAFLPRSIVGFSVLILAALMWFVSLVGLYGSLTHALVERNVEIGVRLALGGRPVTVARELAWQEWRLVAIGILSGLALTRPVRALVAHVLVGIQGVDATFAYGGAASFLLLSLWWCAYPIRRAVTTSPQKLLRTTS